MSYTLSLNGVDVEISATSGGLRIVEEAEDTARLVLEGPGAVGLRASRGASERFVGFGEQFGRLEQSGRRWRGRTLDLLLAEPRDSYFPLPFLLSSAGYGMLLDTQVPATWDLTGADWWTVEVPAAVVTVRLFRGSPKDVVARLTSVTGRPPLPVPWLLGVWKTVVGGTEAALRQAERLQANRLPVSACWVYDHYDEATNSGCGASGPYARGPYPSLSRLTDGLHGLGYRALGYVQPCLYYDSQPYREAERRGWLMKGTDGSPAVIPFFNPKTHPEVLDISNEGGAYVDLTVPDALTWYQSLLDGVMSQGFDGWMQDMGEHVPDDAMYADGETGATNRYPLLYHRAAYPIWSSKADSGIFARSATIGALPYLPAMWPGDQRCDWGAERGLASVLPAGPSAGLAGVGAWGPDIAGIVDGDRNGALDEELWIRWCQYAALTPIMRDHLGFKINAGAPIDLWSTPQTVSTWRTYADLHLRLYPYLRACAEVTSEAGIPIVRPLLLDYPEYDEAWIISDQYLLGDALLVAPVRTKGERSRRVWLPPGEWIDWWDGRRRSGPAWHEVPAPLERIPLLQRSETSIPLLRSADPELRQTDVEMRRV